VGQAVTRRIVLFLVPLTLSPLWPPIRLTNENEKEKRARFQSPHGTRKSGDTVAGPSARSTQTRLNRWYAPGRSAKSHPNGWEASSRRPMSSLGRWWSLGRSVGRVINRWSRLRRSSQPSTNAPSDF